MKSIKCFRISHILAFFALIVLVSSALVPEAGANDRRSSRKNMVQVDVVPVQLISGQAVKFEVRMTTHSVDLSQDMVAVSLLKDDNGQEYRPLGWNGSPPGGHHRSGVLEFPALKGNPKTVTLVIKDIAQVPARTFEWKVQR
jgi:hypothetical protein